MGHCEIGSKYLENISKKQLERSQMFRSLKENYKLDEKRQVIVSLSMNQLLESLRSRNVTASEVLSAFISKSLQVNDKVNCITEFIPDAVQWADDLDEMHRGGGTRGPLHGLPVAIKDDFNVRGMDTTLGFGKYLYKPANESAALVNAFLKLGAVPFCKTNVPQSTLSIGSDNPIFGETLHGTKFTMTPGGSSSGSCALVAAGGCHIATGSDMGGSLRIPAHYHGICSLKGTLNRLSGQGLVPCLPLLEVQASTPGIIARDPETLSFVWKCLLQDNLQNELDPCALPIPWNDQLFSGTKPLRIGYILSLPFFPVFPCTRETVLKAKNALIGDGHQIVPFHLPDESVFLKVVSKLELGDKQAWWEKTFEGEVVGKCMEGFVQDFVGGSIGAKGDKNTIRFGLSSTDGATQILDCVQRKEVIRRDILERMQDAGIDLIMTPAFPHPAVRLEDSMSSSGASVYMYTRLWNYLDFPAGVVPFGKEQEICSMAHPLELEDSQWEQVKNAVKHSVGMPINIQIIGKPFKEELVLRAMEEIHKPCRIMENH